MVVCTLLVTKKKKKTVALKTKKSFHLVEHIGHQSFGTIEVFRSVDIVFMGCVASLLEGRS